MLRRLGRDFSAAKAPLMPHVAQLLNCALVTWGYNLGVRRARTAILLCIYFGWRSSTVDRLMSSDITIDRHLQIA